MARNFKANFKILETATQIKTKIADAAKKFIRKKFALNSSSIEEDVKNLIIQTLKSSNSYKKLISEPVRGEIGFEAGTEQSRVNAIIRAVAESVKIDFPLSNHSSQGAKKVVKIRLLPKTFRNIYGMEEANIYTNKGAILPWFKWLMEKGGEVIIDEYEPILIPGKGRSRIALMIKKGGGGFWKIPLELQGTRENNWITRELSTATFKKKLRAVVASSLNK